MNKGDEVNKDFKSNIYNMQPILEHNCNLLIAQIYNKTVKLIKGE